jgi:hypothetical protein
MLIHREALELSRNAAAGDDGVPFAISCLHVSEDGAVTVTDGHHWLRMQAAVDEPSLFDELAEQGAGAESEGPVLVPADVMAAFSAAMKKRKAKKGQPVPHVVVTQKGNSVTLASSDGKTKRTFLLDAIEVEYPNVDRTVLAHAPVREVLLGVDLLYLMLRTLKACGAVSIRFGIPQSKEAPIRVSTVTATGPIDGAIMPMKPGEQSEES